jgi:Protein of unknown function (DUF3891)
MLFRTEPSGVLAISQPTHAWISGQILRAWDEALAKPLLLAAEQHDIGWLDWETAPTFNPQTGRPHLFREIGAAVHSPMWRQGVERALGAWGAHVALLVSRHGGVIYRRYTDRHRVSEADAAAAQTFLETQAPIEVAWAKMLGLDAATLQNETMLVALVDTLSLALCGELRTPIELEAPTSGGGTETLTLTERPGHPFDFVLSPWPLRESLLTVEGEARPLPATGRFADEMAMRTWLKSPERTVFRARLMSKSAIG